MDVVIATRSAVLQALMRGEAYGLEVIDRARELTDGRLLLAQGTVYPMLRRLEREGLLETRQGESSPERGGRPRRYYKLTAEGSRVASEEAKMVLGLFGVPAAELGVKR